MKTHEAMLAVLGCIGLLAVASASVLAQHEHEASPYAHGQSSEVSSLTADEVRELRNGEGMGLARAAELNHFPGPKHLLELVAELDLDQAQVERIQAIHKRMKGQAVAKGEEILEAESRLANLFASGQPSVAKLRRMTQQLGIMRGQLQAIHLLAHIESAGVLADEQIENYDRLRGYRH